MAESLSIRERRERNRKQRVRLRERRGRGEGRSTVTGVGKAATTAGGKYVYVYDWNAVFFPYTYTLEVSAMVNGVGSNSLSDVSISMLSANGGTVYATAEMMMNEEDAGNVDILGSTGLLEIMPATVFSTVSGTVNTSNGPQPFSYNSTLYVYSSDGDVEES